MRFIRRIVVMCAAALVLTSNSAAEPSSKRSQSRGFPVPFWYSLDKGSAQKLESMIEEFEASRPHLDIIPRNFSSSEEMYRLMEQGEKPVFAVIEGNQLERLDASTELTEVETWMPREDFLFSWSVKHDTYAPLFLGCSVGDRLMARPFYFSTTALIYNPEILETVGVKAAPQTWAEVDQISEKIRSKDPSAWGFGFRTTQELNDTVTLMLMQQERLEPESSLVKVVERGQALAQNVGMPEEVRSSSQLAMRAGTVTDYLEMRREGLPVRVAGVPGPDANHRRTDFKVWGLGMFPVDSSDLYKAQEFAFWLMDFPQQRVWAENTPYLSAHVKVFDNPFYRQSRAEEHSNLRVFINLLSRADRPPAPVAEKGELMEKLATIFPKLLRGEIDSAAAIKMFAARVAKPAETGPTSKIDEIDSFPEATPVVPTLEN